MIRHLTEGLDRRALGLLGLAGAVLVAAPWVVDQYVLSVLIITLYFAYVGQAWNLMMGMAGQLSLGHTLYVGLGAYVSAAAFVHFGLSPWIGGMVGVAISALMGAAIGFLAFRFKIGGVYFALLTIAFAEFTRILFEHWQWVGASGGFFLPVASRTTNDLWTLRGGSMMFYYVILALTFGALLLSRWLMRSRLGYFWLALREDEDAAQALGINTFRCKMIAVMLSAGLTAVGGVFTAFYYNSLFPGQSFAMHRSIELILAPIVGGLGTLAGPIVGSFLLTPLGEGLTLLVEKLGLQGAGIKQLFYGVILMVIIVFLPGGVWPWLVQKLGLDRKGGGP